MCMADDNYRLKKIIYFLYAQIPDLENKGVVLNGQILD